MDCILRKLRNIMARFTRVEPVRHTDASRYDWMPPVLGPTDLCSHYFLTMADRETAWYFDQR